MIACSRVYNPGGIESTLAVTIHDAMRTAEIDIGRCPCGKAAAIGKACALSAIPLAHQLCSRAQDARCLGTGQRTVRVKVSAAVARHQSQPRTKDNIHFLCIREVETGGREPGREAVLLLHQLRRQSAEIHAGDVGAVVTLQRLR